MRYVLRDVQHSVRASPVFVFYVLVTVAIAAVIGVITFQPDLLGMEGFGHFGEQRHRVHDLTYGFLFTTGVVGVLTQLRRPAKNVASMVMAVIPWVALLLAAIFSAAGFVILSTERLSVAAVTVIVVLLHPSGRAFFRSFGLDRINWLMVALVAVAAVPLLVFASTNVRLQGAVADDHAGLGHYGFMAAFSFTVVGTGLLASLRPAGWRLTAWAAGLLPALVGLASLVYQDESSSLDVGWALAAIAWGVGFVSVAERARAAARPTPLAPDHEVAESVRT